jgi:hypothetical protein
MTREADQTATNILLRSVAPRPRAEQSKRRGR